MNIYLFTRIEKKIDKLFTEIRTENENNDNCDNV